MCFKFHLVVNFKSFPKLFSGEKSEVFNFVKGERRSENVPVFFEKINNHQVKQVSVKQVLF